MDNYLDQQIKEIGQKIEEAKKLLDDPQLSDLAQIEVEELEKQKEELIQSANIPKTHKIRREMKMNPTLIPTLPF